MLDVPNEKHHPLVKRLVATPGQTLIVRDGRLYADGERVFPADDSLNAPRLDYRGHLQEGVKQVISSSGIIPPTAATAALLAR